MPSPIVPKSDSDLSRPQSPTEQPKTGDGSTQSDFELSGEPSLSKCSLSLSKVKELVDEFLKNKVPDEVIGLLIPSEFDATTYKMIAETVATAASDYLVQYEIQQALYKMKESDYDSLFEMWKDQNREIGALKYNLEVAGKELDELRILVDYRGYIQIVEYSCFPDWLFQASRISRRWRWQIALTFQLSRDLSIIYDRISKKSLNIRDVAETIGNAYREICGSVLHSHTYPNLSNLSDSQWAALYKKLKVYDENAKLALRSVLTPVKLTERKQKGGAKNYEYNAQLKVRDYVLELVYNKTATVDRMILENMLGQEFRENFETFVIQQNTPNYIQSVFLYIRGITSVQLRQLENDLKLKPSITTVNSKIAYC